MTIDDLKEHFTFSDSKGNLFCALTDIQLNELFQAIFFLLNNESASNSLKVLLNAIKVHKQTQITLKYQDIDILNNTCGNTQSREAYQVFIGYQQAIKEILTYIGQPNSELTEYAVKSVNNSFLIKLKTIWNKIKKILTIKK